MELEHHWEHEERRVQRREENVSPLRLRLLHRAHAHLASLARFLLHSKIQIHPRKGQAREKTMQPCSNFNINLNMAFLYKTFIVSNDLVITWKKVY